MITVQLSTSEKKPGLHIASADVDGTTYSAQHRTKSPIHMLARKLLEANCDPLTPITIYRGAMRVLHTPIPLVLWAGQDVIDSAAGRLRTVAYREYPTDEDTPEV